MSPSVHSRPEMMGLCQALNPSPAILPMDGGMALPHFVATKKPPTPENSQSRRWGPLWGSGDFAEFPGGGGAGGRGRDLAHPRARQKRIASATAQEFSVREARASWNMKAERDSKSQRSDLVTDALPLRHTHLSRDGKQAQSQLATARQSGALPKHIIRIRYRLAG